MIALISDIHANKEALEAVVQDISSQGIDRIFCLGDIVGYGPEPTPCVDLVEKLADVCICGNHDYALIYGATDFNVVAADAINYHRHVLMPNIGKLKPSESKMKRWQYLKRLPFRHMEGNYLFVHGSPRNPINEYITETDVRWGLEKKLTEIFSLVENICFVGHTHRPGVLTQNIEFLTLQDLDNTYEITPDTKAIINIGSVGQPRDGDPRACYATLEDNIVRYRRVPYELEAVCRKITATGILDESLAERLRVGR